MVAVHTTGESIVGTATSVETAQWQTGTPFAAPVATLRADLVLSRSTTSSSPNGLDSSH